MQRRGPVSFLHAGAARLIRQPNNNHHSPSRLLYIFPSINFASLTCTTTSCSNGTRPFARHFGGSPLSSSAARGLPPPTILYSDNHILVVNKPPGWHVVPNKTNTTTTTTTTSTRRKSDLTDWKVQHDDNNSNNNRENQSNNTTTTSGRKCLLTYLQNEQYGGGSQHTFLKPLHRIDQPCSGVVLFAKTSKAASRIAKCWKTKEVVKTYLCLISNTKLENLQRNSYNITITTTAKDNNTNDDTAAANHHKNKHDDTTTITTTTNGDDIAGNDTEQNKKKQGNHYEGWWKLQGYLHDRKRRPDAKGNNVGPVGWSVVITKEAPPKPYKSRHLQLYWRVLPLLSSSSSLSEQTNVLVVHARDGSRHMVRALLGHIGGCPILGDARYGSNLFLEDQSVGLHARSLLLPSNLQLGSTTQRHFEAPIPATWKRYAGPHVTEAMVVQGTGIEDDGRGEG